MDIDQAATVLFGQPADSPGAPTPGAEPSPSPDDALARKLYDAPTGPDYFGDATRAIVTDLRERELMPDQDAQAQAATWSPVFAELGLSSVEASNVVDAAIAAARNAGDDGELAASWAADAANIVRQDYGPEGAGQALADARALVARYPKIARMLEETGLGNHPAIVRIACAKARALRLRGEL